MSKIDLPEKLQTYLLEQQNEGRAVIGTTGFDDFVWIIPSVHSTKSEPWITYISWYEGAKDYNLVNITGKAAKELLKELNRD